MNWTRSSRGEQARKISNLHEFARGVVLHLGSFSTLELFVRNAKLVFARSVVKKTNLSGFVFYAKKSGKMCSKYIE